MNITTSQHNLNTTSRLETQDLNTQVITCKGACKGDNVFVEIVVEHKKKMYWGYSTGHRLFQTVNIAAESPSTVRRRVVLVLLLVLLLCCVVLCCVVLCCVVLCCGISVVTSRRRCGVVRVVSALAPAAGALRQREPHRVVGCTVVAAGVVVSWHPGCIVP